jgi:hypothetical protein
MRDKDIKAVINQKPDGGVDIVYSITRERLTEKLSNDNWYSIRRDAEQQLSSMLAQKFFEDNADDLLSKITFEEVKSVLMLQLGQELLKKMNEMSGNRY